MKNVNWRTRVAQWFRRLTERERFVREIRDEFESHVAHRADHLVRAGQPRAEAERIARAEFGSVESYVDDSRSAAGFRVVGAIESIVADIRHACRVWRRAPTVATVAILSLALGIGANSVVFSVVNAVWFKPLAIDRPDGLVTLTMDLHLPGIDYPTVQGFMARSDVLGPIAGVATTSRSNIAIVGVSSSEDWRPASVHLVSGTYFSLLGVHAARGRVIEPYDDVIPRGHPVAVISEAYRRRRFAADSLVVGRELRVNTTEFTIVGVAPSAFVGDVVGEPADVWIPIAMTGEVIVERPDLLTNPNPPWVRILGRTTRTLSAVTLGQRATTIYQQLLINRVGGSSTPTQAADIARRVIRAFPAGHGDTGGETPLRTPLALVWGTVALLLILSCTNVAGLLLGRATTREHEIATRAAIGASRARIVLQLSTEAGVIVAIGSVIGIATAWMSLPLIAAAMEASHAGSFDLAPSRDVLAATVTTCILAALITGLAPSMFAGRVSLTRGLNARSLSNRRRILGLSSGNLLVVGQVALSLTLAVGAALLTRSLANLRRRDIGLDRTNTLVVVTAPMQAGIVRQDLASLYDATIASVTALPGVVSVSASSRGVLNDVLAGSPIRVPGYIPRPDDEAFVAWNQVAPGYFETIGVRVLAGRGFTASDDANAAPVAIVTESTAQHYFGSLNAVGRHFGLRRGEQFPLEIVGVVSNAVDNSMHEKAGTDMIYLPYRQDVAHLVDLSLVVKTRTPTAALVEGVRRALHTVNPSLPILNVETVDGRVAMALAQDRVISAVATTCAGFAFSLAMVGLYAVVAQGVASRRGEMAVRLALGAPPMRVVRLILGETLLVVGIGLTLGCIGAIAGALEFSSQLFGVAPYDPASIAFPGLLLVAMGTIAALVPALRAAGADPNSVLRAS